MRRALLLLALATASVAAAPAALPEHPSPAPPDVVLVTIDTLRWDATGFDGRSPSPTPHLDRLAATGRVFTDAHAHNVITLPSHTNILTGLYPYQHGVRDNGGFHLAADVPTLATAFHAAGYATGAFVGAYPLDHVFGLDGGFDVYDDHYPKGSAPADMKMPERPGTEVVAAALAWWQRSAGKPRFLWVHVYEPHAPYAPPEPFASRWRDSPYLGEVATADGELAPLFEQVLAQGPTRSVIAVTGDHGEGLGEHGEETHGLFAYEPTLKVPLLLWGRGVAHGRDDRAARHVDIFPTLLAAAGVPAPPSTRGARPGRSLLAPAVPVDSYFEALSATFNRGWAPLRGVLHDGRKAIALPLPELYLLPRDPREQHNLASERRPVLRADLSALPQESTWPPPRGAVSGEEEARLRNLGYVTGVGSTAKSWGPADDPKNLVELDHQIRRVLELYARRDLGPAVQQARAVVAARPDMPLGYLLLAETLLESDDSPGALAVMETARSHGAATDSVLVQLGLTLSQSGRSDEAIAVLRPLAGRNEPRALDALGLALSDAGKQDEADSELRHALALDPQYAPALEHRALVALRTHHPAAAAELAQQAVTLNPSLEEAWNDLGAALFALGERERAVDAWERAVALAPRLWDALWNLGTQAAALGRTEVARRALTSFVAHAPTARYARDVARARRLLQSLGEAH